MKRNIRHILGIAAVLTLGSAFASCSQEEMTEAGSTGIRSLTITVADGGYTTGDDSPAATRTVEAGYTTQFAAGDNCGLFVVRNGSVVLENIKLTAKDINGSLKWEADTTLACTGKDNERYFLYYPYCSDNTKLNVDASAEDANGFFAQLISSWQVNADQSSYAKYTASDLMTAKANTSVAGSTLKLSFPMEHQMGLAIIKVPELVYKFSSQSQLSDYTVRSADFDSNPKPLFMPSDSTYRFIVHPQSESSTDIKGTYYNGTNGKNFTVPAKASAGSYKTYIVDGAVSNTKTFTLQKGDFILKNGNFVSKDSVLTEEQKAQVAAIVFWTPAEPETNATGRNTPASLTDDQIMAKDYPHCTHGLAVAVKHVTDLMSWQDSCESVYETFQTTDNFTDTDKDNYKPIFTNTGATDPMNYILGYQNTKLLRAYNDYCASNGKSRNIVEPVANMDKWAEDNPAPLMSTGWFFPSSKELHMMCYKDVDNVYKANNANNANNANYTQTRDTVNASLDKLGTRAEKIIYNNSEYEWDKYGYWASQEAPYDGNKEAYASLFHFHKAVFYIKSLTALKKMNRYVRAVCAF